MLESSVEVFLAILDLPREHGLPNFEKAGRLVGHHEVCGKVEVAELDVMDSSRDVVGVGLAPSLNLDPGLFSSAGFAEVWDPSMDRWMFLRQMQRARDVKDGSAAVPDTPSRSRLQHLVAVGRDLEVSAFLYFIAATFLAPALHGSTKTSLHYQSRSCVYNQMLSGGDVCARALSSASDVLGSG